MKCLVVDIGNTSTAVALAAGGRIMRRRDVAGKLVDRPLADSTVRSAAGHHRPEGAILASVVPAATQVWKEALALAVGRSPMIVSRDLKLGVGIDYPKPESIGADRLANASGAVGRYGSPVVVADFGTALTFDVVAAGDVYVGGVIAPGLPLMTDYLAERTALLPRIRLRGPCGRVGRSTAGAMRIGAHIGYRGIVREIVMYLEQQFGMPFKLCATGGYARWALAGLDLPFELNPDLTLYGLSRIFGLNESGGDRHA